MNNLRLTFRLFAVVALLLTAAATAKGADHPITPCSDSQQQGPQGKSSKATAADEAAVAGFLREVNKGSEVVAQHKKRVTRDGFSGMWMYLFVVIVVLVAAGLCYYFARRVDQAGNTRLRWTYGAKLVGGFCVLIFALTGVSFWALSGMREVGTEIEILAEEIIPITAAVTNIDVHQLEQAIALQRAFRFGQQEGAKLPEEFTSSVERFEHNAKKVDSELLQAAKALEEVAAPTREEAKAISVAMDALARIDAKHARFDALARKAIELIRTDKHGQARLLEKTMESVEEELEQELTRFLGSLQDRTQNVAVQVAEDEQRAAMRIMIVAILSILIGFGFAVTYTRRFSLAIHNLLEASKKVAAGDLSNRVEVTGTDELGELGESLNQMVTTFRDVASVCDAVVVGDYSTKVTLKGDKDKLGVAVNQMIDNLGTVVQQVYVSGSRMVSACGEQAEGAKNQSVATEEMTSTVTELLASARQMAENAGNVSERAELAASECSIGTASVESTVQGIQGVHERVDKIAAHMLELGSKSQQISSVLDIITELSEQTNLLSLNASIEAAGAGDAGKRFAVVASEIRKLAERATESTVEVRGLIDSVQQTVNATIMATEEGTKAVQEGVRLTAEVDKSFGRIAEQVASTTQSAKAIEMGSRQQASAVEQMEAAVRNVDTAAQQTAETAREVDSSAQELLETARKLQGSEHELQTV